MIEPGAAQKERRPAMRSNRKEAARRKLLTIMPRAVLEELSQLDRPHMESISGLILAASQKWDEESVKAEVDRILHLARDDHHQNHAVDYSVDPSWGGR